MFRCKRAKACVRGEAGTESFSGAFEAASPLTQRHATSTNGNRHLSHRRDKKNKPNVNAGHGFRHLTPLHAACANSHELVAASLVDAKAEINALDASNMTPLHYAVAAGSIRTVEMLLSRGADVGAVDKFMRTPLLTAIEMAHGHEGR